MEQRIVAFISFTKQDNKYLEGYLSRLCKEIEKSIGFLSGQNLSVFNPEYVQFGEHEDNRYKEVIEESIVFIPIITPWFFNDDKCRSHVEFFIQKEKERRRNDLIIPLYYQRPQSNDKDELMQIISERYPIEWEDSAGESLRGQPFQHGDVQARLEKIASRVVDIYRDIIRVKQTDSHNDFIERRYQDTTEKIKKIEDYLANLKKSLEECMISYDSLRATRAELENAKNRITMSVKDIQRREWSPLVDLAVRNRLIERGDKVVEARELLSVKIGEATKIISDFIEKVRKEQEDIPTEQAKLEDEIGIEQQKHDYYMSRLDFETSIRDLHGESRAKRLCERIVELPRDIMPSYSEDKEEEFSDLVRDIDSDIEYYQKLLADDGFDCSEIGDSIAGDSE